MQPDKAIGDPRFARALQENINVLCARTDFKLLKARLAELDPSAAYLLSQPESTVLISGRPTNVGTSGLIDGCLSDLIVDHSFLKSYEQINPLEVMEHSNYEHIILLQCKAGSTLPKLLSSLVLQSRYLPDSASTTNLERATQMLQNMLDALGISMSESYYKVITDQLTCALKGKT